MADAPSNPIHSPCDASLDGKVFVDLHFDSVSRLTWELIDQTIDRDGLERLETALRQSATARKQYVDIMQLHGDLSSMFGQAPQAKPASDGDEGET